MWRRRKGTCDFEGAPFLSFASILAASVALWLFSFLRTVHVVHTVTIHIKKNPVASNGEGWAVATAPQPDRYKHIGVVQKEAVAREGGLRQVFPPNPAPLRAVGFGWRSCDCVCKRVSAGIVHVQSSPHAMRGDHPRHMLLSPFLLIVNLFWKGPKQREK